MAHAESEVLNRWRLKWAKWAVLFRNNTGVFLTMDGKRKVQAGLGKGTADFVGWKTVKVTQDMVGKPVAIFCAVEGKTEDGSLTEEQRHFLQTVRIAGGIAFVVRSEDTKPIFWGE